MSSDQSTGQFITKTAIKRDKKNYSIWIFIILNHTYKLKILLNFFFCQANILKIILRCIYLKDVSIIKSHTNLVQFI